MLAFRGGVCQQGCWLEVMGTGAWWPHQERRGRHGNVFTRDDRERVAPAGSARGPQASLALRLLRLQISRLAGASQLNRLVVTLAALLPVIMGATPAPQQAFQGAYVHDPSAGDDVDQAIETVVRRLSVLVRGVARRRLREVNQPYGHMAVSLEEGQVGIEVDHGGMLWTNDSESPVEWTDEAGRTSLVRTRWHDDRLQRTYQESRGRRVNTLSLSADGKTLRLHVRMESHHLPAPVTYTLVYRRVRDP
ncbi:MAG: hypothetical protein ACOC0J_01885 [Myxococcota bacterium]